MKMNIGCRMNCFGSERMENTLKAMSQCATIDKELLKVEDCPNPNYLNSKKSAYSLP